jgi:hypothetical protein
MARRYSVLALTVLGLASAGAARADSGWSSEADVGVTVNGHAFHHARIDGNGCTVKVKLEFEAPEKGYSDPKNLVRNYHRFRARIRLAKGQFVASKIFGNSGAGERTYSFEDDTSATGCWSKEPGKLVKVDVIGCRGRGCDVGAFD